MNTILKLIQNIRTNILESACRFIHCGKHVVIMLHVIAHEIHITEKPL